MKKFGNIAILETLAEIAAPAHTALVVWDSQNSLVNHIFNREEYLANLQTLLAAARRKNVTVVYTKITPIPNAFQSGWNLSQSLKRFNIDDPAKIPTALKPGSPEAEINEKVWPAESDLILPKQSPNIFFGTNFEQLMRFRGIETLLFTGIATEYGIEHSARESSIRGFYTVVVADCVSSPDKANHEMVLKLLPKFCLVNTSQDIIKTWV
jgi:nicotinamidase-related amidase